MGFTLFFMWGSSLPEYNNLLHFPNIFNINIKGFFFNYFPSQNMFDKCFKTNTQLKVIFSNC